MASHLNF